MGNTVALLCFKVAKDTIFFLIRTIPICRYMAYEGGSGAIVPIYMVEGQRVYKIF